MRNPPRRAGPVAPRAFDPRNTTRLIPFTLRATRLIFRTTFPRMLPPSCPLPFDLKWSPSLRASNHHNPDGYPYSLDRFAWDRALRTLTVKPTELPSARLVSPDRPVYPLLREAVGFPTRARRLSLPSSRRSGGLWEAVPVAPSPGVLSKAMSDV